MRRHEVGMRRHAVVMRWHAVGMWWACGGPCWLTELLDGGEAHATDDGDEAEPLGLGDRLAVQGRADDGGEGGLRRLDDLGEGDGAEIHREDRGQVRAGRARRHREDLQRKEEWSVSMLRSWPPACCLRPPLLDQGKNTPVGRAAL